MKSKIGNLFVGILILFMASCRPLTQPLDTPTASIVSLKSTLVRKTVTPSPTITLTPSPSTTATPTATQVPSPEPTWTPLPTLLTSEAAALVQDLLKNNGDCRLPCWWGIIPGETSWLEARQFLATFATRIGQGDSGIIMEEGISYQVTNYSVAFDIEGGLRGGGALFSIRNGIISFIDITPSSTVQSFQLHQLLSDYGKPDKVFIETYQNTPGLGLPFQLVLFYPGQRIQAFYEYTAQKAGDVLIGCPQPVGPILSVWGPYKALTDKDLITSGPDNPQPFKLLEEVTDMSIDAFYQAFQNPESKICIETPADLW